MTRNLPLILRNNGLCMDQFTPAAITNYSSSVDSLLILWDSLDADQLAGLLVAQQHQTALPASPAAAAALKLPQLSVSQDQQDQPETLLPSSPIVQPGLKLPSLSPDALLPSQSGIQLQSQVGTLQPSQGGTALPSQVGTLLPSLSNFPLPSLEGLELPSLPSWETVKLPTVQEKEKK